ncbi:MAG: TIGR01777 family oxidoreductase [Saprospiraceae bacterium]|nr:TIGR01777 family oxidoreductase [Saprospiraceae bacterium]
MSENVLITGGSGLIGSELSKLLLNNNYNFAILSRSPKMNDKKSYYWNYEKGILDEEAIEFADVIIHLAGENISTKRWTKSQKQKIIDSRVNTTNLLFEKIKNASKKPKAFISASAIGYYGTFTSDEIFDEESKAGNDFLAETVVKWEESVEQIKSLGLRVVKLRTGVVFSKKGGAMPKMMKPVKMGFGSAIGSGKQYVPWIEISDLARLYLYAIENEEMNTVYNAVSPNHITNYELMKAIAVSLKKPFFMPKIPSIFMKLAFGEMASILLEGSRVSSEKIQKAGFDFKVKSIEDVMK